MDVETYTNFLLLQCASTFNWDVLHQRCIEISDLLEFSSIQLSISEQQKRRVSDAIQQLSQQDQYGNNCLHAACYNRPPLRVITGILQCAARANLQLHKVLTLDRSTPLGIACATGASVDVIKILLDPPYGLEHGGGLVSLPDSRGCAPLTELVTHYELQRKTPGVVEVLGSLDSVQLNLSNHAGNDNFPVTNAALNATRQNHDEDSPFQEFWNKVELLIKAAWFDANSTNNFNFPGSWVSILHGASFVGDNCPAELTMLICRSYGDKARRSNRQGLLPLHLAILSGSSASVWEKPSQETHPSLSRTHRQQRRALWIKTLLELYPEAAAVPFQDGRSILCSAIASDLHWNISNLEKGKIFNHSSDSKSKDDAATGPLQYIWKACPEVLGRKDSQTGLYPFLLAARATDGGTSDRKKIHTSQTSLKDQAIVTENPACSDLNQLTTIYGLVRLHPQLLSQLVASHVAGD
jgi:hypothetical protein